MNSGVSLSTKVVKIAFWLVKSYDFTSQNMLYVLNRLKKSKMGEIGLKSSEIAKNHDFRADFTILTERMHWSKMSPPCSSCPAPIGCAIKCTVTRSSLAVEYVNFVCTVHSANHKEVDVRNQEGCRDRM
jgi:hypothetical protein